MADKSTLLFEHYKDTCSIISEAIKRRDRLMLFVVITLGFFAFQTIFPDASNTAVNDFLSFKFGLTLQLDLSIIGNVVWFLLLVFTMRYFQVSVFVERQYSYIHKVEEKLNKELGEKVITREGEDYLYKYPLFSNWMGLLYTIVFPLLLLVISGTKIVTELRHDWSINLFLDCTFFLLLAISIILYLIMLHFKFKTNELDQKNI